jgi:hypothetical protein
MKISTTFLGGVGSPDHFPKLKNWFYFGLNKCHKLSRRKISSVGQKQPDDAAEKHKRIVLRIARHQTPVQRPDGTYRGNSDQVPTYVEPHGNYQWGDETISAEMSKQQETRKIDLPHNSQYSRTVTKLFPTLSSKALQLLKVMLAERRAPSHMRYTTICQTAGETSTPPKINVS